MQLQLTVLCTMAILLFINILNKRRKLLERKSKEKFDANYVSAITSIQNTNDATVYYHEKADVKTAKLSELSFQTTVNEDTEIATGETVIQKETTIIDPIVMDISDKLSITPFKDRFRYLGAETEKALRDKDEASNLIPATVSSIKANEVEIPATWFLILNSPVYHHVCAYVL